MSGDHLDTALRPSPVPVRSAWCRSRLNFHSARRIAEDSTDHSTFA
jgi:hypothetical protein